MSAVTPLLSVIEDARELLEAAEEAWPERPCVVQMRKALDNADFQCAEDTEISAVAWMFSTAETLDVMHRSRGLSAVAGALTAWIDTARRTDGKALRAQIARLESTAAALACELVELRKENEQLKDSEMRRSDWLHKAKREFGVSDNVSFDVVWDNALESTRVLSWVVNNLLTDSQLDVTPPHCSKALRFLGRFEI